MDEAWTDISVASVSEGAAPPVKYLVAAGLSEADSRHVVEVAGVSTKEDLLLLEDKALLSQVVTEANLKLIPSKKLSNAVHVLVEQKIDVSRRQTTECQTNADDKKQPDADECIVVAIDRSGSMGSAFEEARAFGANAEKTLLNRSRMDAVKQVFYAFRDRVETLDEVHHKVGLIQFDGHIERMLEVTSDLEKFESVVDDMTRRGSTAIYSAIRESCRMLKPFAESSKIDLRVLVLTDGQSNAGISPREALQEVQEIGAVVDAILVGDNPDNNLRKIVAASGGSCFQIHSLSDGFELMEAEAVVSLRSRRGGGDKPERKLPFSVDFDSILTQKITLANQASTVSTVTSNTQGEPQKLVPWSSIDVSEAKGPATIRRIFKELRDFTAANNNDNNEGIHLYADQNNPYQMKALIAGPGETPFEGGVFALTIVLPRDYPFKPPKVHFETPIFHCNVSSTGGLCLDILKDQWSPSKTIYECVTCIREMLSNPNTDDALRPTIAELYFAYRESGGDDTRYDDQAKVATLRDAARTVGEWNALWGVSES